jgi:thiamine-monophosphate kinase
MIDVSDGLVADVGHVAEDSGVSIDLHRDAFVPDEPLVAVGSALGADPLAVVLGGGEDHALVATFPPGVALPEGFRAVGLVGAPGPGGPVVTLDGAAYDGPAGHTHF